MTRFAAIVVAVVAGFGTIVVGNLSRLLADDVLGQLFRLDPDEWRRQGRPFIHTNWGKVPLSHWLDSRIAASLFCWRHLVFRQPLPPALLESPAAKSTLRRIRRCGYIAASLIIVCACAVLVATTT